MAYKTGRIRALVCRGTIALPDMAFAVGDGTGYHGYSAGIYDTDASVSFGSCSVVYAGTVTHSPSTHFFAKFNVSAGGLSDSFYTDLEYPTGTGYGASNHDVTIGGDYTFTVDVEEVVTISVPDAVTSVDGANFPNWGPFLSTWGPSAIRMIYSEQLRVGGSISAECGGISLSSEITSASSAPYSVTIRAGVIVACSAVSYTGSSVTLPSVSRSGSITANTSGFLGFSIPLTGSVSDSGGVIASGDLSGGVSITASAHDTGGTSSSKSATSYAHGDGSGNPAIKYSADCRAFLPDGSAYPNNALLWTILQKNGVASPTFAGASVSTSWSQDVYSGSLNLNGTTSSASKDDRVPVRSGLCSMATDGTGEDYRDWRVLGQIYPWTALTLSQDATKQIANGATLTPSSESITLTQSNLEGYRYMRVAGMVLSSSGSTTATRTLVLTVGSKTYELVAITPSSTTHDVIIDLCSPSNLPSGFTKDSRLTRWPLNDTATQPGVNGTPSYSSASDGGLWGDLEHPSSVSISGLQTGDSLAVSSINLQQSSTGTTGMFQPYGSETSAWNGYASGSQTDSTYCDPDFSILTDGKQTGPWPGRFRIVPTSSSILPSYNFYSITSFAAMLSGTPGWTATVGTAPTTYPVDGTTYLVGPSNPALYIPPVLCSGTSWPSQMSMSVGSAIQAAYCYDECQVYPGCGDPTADYMTDGSGAFPYRASKVLRGGANGIVFNTDGTPNTTATVNLDNATTTSTIYGTSSTDSMGSYSTGSPFAPGNTSCITQVISGPNRTATSQNRFMVRTSFLKTNAVVKVLAYDESSHLIHGRVTLQGGTEIFVGTSGNGAPSAWTDLDSSIAGSNASARYSHYGNQLLGMVYTPSVTSTMLYFVQSQTRGRTWGTSLTIASTLAANGFFDFDEGTDFQRWFYWMEGSTTYALYMCKVDNQGHITKARTATTITSLDLAPVKVKFFPVSGGGRKIGILYSTGGTLTFTTSSDGVNFS